MAGLTSALRTLRESASLLATRRFGTFWVASLLSSIGTWAQQVAQPWLMLTLGASSFLLGLDTFAMNAPVWLLTLLGGLLADRADRRRVIALFQSIQMLCPTAIVALLVTGTARPWMIVVCSLVVGVTDALSMPSFQSIVPSITRREQIPQGLALNSTQFNLSRILGPSLAGVLMTTVGALGAFVVSAVSYVPFIGVALWILPPWNPPPADARPPRRHPFTGAAEVLRQPLLRGAVLTVLGTSFLCAPLITFSPVLVRDVFHSNAARFSASIAAFGVGGLIGATGLLAVPLHLPRHRIASAFAVLYGAVLVLTGLNPWFWVVPALLALAGAAMTVSNTAANSLLQSSAPPHLLGQTVSVFMLVIRGGMALGALLTGLMVGLLGVRHALLLNGVLALALQLPLQQAWSKAEAAKAA